VSGNPANLTWTGAADTTSWDIGATGQQNWTSTAPTDPNRFYNQDSVTFANSANFTVNIIASVLPSSVNFTNDASHNYVINSSGGFGIGESGSGTSLSLNGLGSVTLNTLNTYAGATNVNSGQLIIGATGAIAGSTLAIAPSATATVNTGGSVTSTSVNVSGNLFAGGSVGGTTMTVGGTGIVTVTSGGNVSTTTANINGGGVTVQSGGTLSSPAVNINGGSVTIQPSGTLASTALSIATGTSLTVQAGGSVSATPSLVNNGSVVLGSDQSFGGLSGTDTTATINVNGTLSVAGNGTYAGTIIDNSPTNKANLTVASGTLTLTNANPYTGNTTINSGATLQVDAGSNTGNLSATTNIIDNGTLIYARTGPQSLGNAFSGTGAFRQIGGDTFTLTGNNVNFSGAIQAYSGTVIQSSTNANTLGSGAEGLVIGTPATSAINTSVGSIVLSSAISATSVGSISSTSGSTTANPMPNTLVIPAGVTLTDAGGFTVGPGQGVFTTLAATGGGSLAINGTISVGGANDTAIADLSALNSVTITNGTVNIGNASPSNGTLTLANTTVGANAPVNVINTATMNFSTTGTATPGTASVLNLGSGSNTISASTINLGTGRGAGVIQFVAGAPSTATLAITGNPTINMALASTNGMQTSIPAVLNLAGHNVNVQAGSINMAIESANLDGGASASIAFDTGTFTAGTITMAGDTGGSSLIGPTATITLGGATPNNTSTSVFNSSNIVMGNFTNTNGFAVASAIATATLTINGGTANVTSGSITNNSTRGTTNSTLTLAGGTLNMNGNFIGGTGGVNSGNGPITVNLPTSGQTAALANLGSSGINGAGLNMNGSGTLILAGSNSYNSGSPIATTVSLGNLVLGNAHAIDSTGGGVALSGGNLGTGGFVQTIPGSLTLSSSAHLNLGLGGQFGGGAVHFNDSSTVNNGIVWDGSSTLTIDNWTHGVDHVFFGNGLNNDGFDGLDASQLLQVAFAGFPGTPSFDPATGELTPPNPGPTFLLGDVNGDGHYDAADIPAEELALINLSHYQNATGNPYGINLTTDEMDAVLDQNHDGVINNIDMQALINNLLAGQGSNSVVPEPASFVLLTIGGTLLLLRKRRKGITVS
ncbi:MAG TPA: autotransporter-associated beta strand repeat-containing protein, partial [Pirellulales bacterium]|nr:autotransporter-associated beta strand repeat-containing protein [Pirellulales bacterium]